MTRATRNLTVAVLCPLCGRFVRSIHATMNDMGLTGVYAKCIAHGSVEPNRFVDGEQVGWSWDDFNSEEQDDS